MGFWTNFGSGFVEGLNDEQDRTRKQQDELVRMGFRNFLENDLPRIRQKQDEYDSIVRTAKVVRARYGDGAANYIMDQRITDPSKAFEIIQRDGNLSKMGPNTAPTESTPAPSVTSGMPDLSNVVGAAVNGNDTGLYRPDAAKDQLPAVQKAAGQLGNVGMDQMKAGGAGGMGSPAPQMPQQAAPNQSAPLTPTQPQTQPTEQPSAARSMLKDAWSVISGKQDAGQLQTRALDQLAAVPGVTKEQVDMIRQGKTPMDNLPQSNGSYMPFKTQDPSGESMADFILANAERFSNAPELVNAAFEGKQSGDFTKLRGMPKDMMTKQQEMGMRFAHDERMAALHRADRGPGTDLDKNITSLLLKNNLTPEEEARLNRLREQQKYEWSIRPQRGGAYDQVAAEAAAEEARKAKEAASQPGSKSGGKPATDSKTHPAPPQGAIDDIKRYGHLKEWRDEFARKYGDEALKRYLPNS